MLVPDRGFAAKRGVAGVIAPIAGVLDRQTESGGMGHVIGAVEADLLALFIEFRDRRWGIPPTPTINPLTTPGLSSNRCGRLHFRQDPSALDLPRKLFEIGLIAWIDRWRFMAVGHEY